MNHPLAALLSKRMKEGLESKSAAPVLSAYGMITTTSGPIEPTTASSFSGSPKKTADKSLISTPETKSEGDDKMLEGKTIPPEEKLDEEKKGEKNPGKKEDKNGKKDMTRQERKEEEEERRKGWKGWQETLLHRV